MHKAARHGAIRTAGTTVADLKNDVRSSSGLNVPNANIYVEVNSADDGSGTWSAVANSGGQNTVPRGRPVRVTISNWRHRLLTGAYFNWLPGVSGGTMPMNAQEFMMRE